jgi:hypothetical protein
MAGVNVRTSVKCIFFPNKADMDIYITVNNLIEIVNTRQQTIHVGWEPTYRVKDICIASYDLRSEMPLLRKRLCAFFFTGAGFRTVFIRNKSRASLKYRFPARAILKIKFFSHICSTVHYHCRGAFPHTLLEEPGGIAIKNKGIIGIPLKEQSHQILDFLVGSMELNQYVL